MISIDKAYVETFRLLMQQGETVQTRNSTVKRGCGVQIVLQATPLISVRKTAWKNALREMEWFLSGSNNIKDLHRSVKSWWKPWADENGFINYNYSTQLRRFVGYNVETQQPCWWDSIGGLIDGIRDHPYSRRNVITTWNTAEMNFDNCPITNCHLTLLQAFVSTGGVLSFLTHQRSVDMVCGLPHNWIQLKALQLWIASRTNTTAGNLCWIGGDCHIYEQHYPIVEEILQTDCSDIVTPQLVYTPTTEEFRADDFTLDREYKPIVKTKAEMIV